MPVSDFLVILVLCATTMILCRVAPVFALNGKELPPGFVTALGFIPPAAFAALVANDLFKPDLFVGDAWTWIAPLIAAAIVAVVGIKTKSMAWCIVVGVGALAALSSVPAALL